LRLVIVGDGPLRGPLERGFAERALSDRVIFCGAISHEEVAGVIRQFDVALAPYPRLPHEFYFSPLKLFEYMACGVAVVASNVGQVADLIRPGKTGLLYPPGDLDALAQSCRRLLDNPRLRRTLARQASKRVHTHHTWDKNASRVIEVAKSLIRARPKSPGPSIAR
jgi:glycosyltransferase involved in cell wall biosynthesis